MRIHQFACLVDKMFRDLSAWFSSSVDDQTKKLWRDNGGRESNFDTAEFIFSSDNTCPDTESGEEADVAMLGLAACQATGTDPVTQSDHHHHHPVWQAATPTTTQSQRAATTTTRQHPTSTTLLQPALSTATHNAPHAQMSRSSDQRSSPRQQNSGTANRPSLRSDSPRGTRVTSRGQDQNGVASTSEQSQPSGGERLLSRQRSDGERTVGQGGDSAGRQGEPGRRDVTRQHNGTTAQFSSSPPAGHKRPAVASTSSHSPSKRNRDSQDTEARAGNSAASRKNRDSQDVSASPGHTAGSNVASQSSRDSRATSASPGQRGERNVATRPAVETQTGSRERGAGAGRRGEGGVRPEKTGAGRLGQGDGRTGGHGVVTGGHGVMGGAAPTDTRVYHIKELRKVNVDELTDFIPGQNGARVVKKRVGLQA